ncbi:MAG TPA: YbaN family protein [Fimbriiglobus sp.]|nr:YbaN family protein [Fimbriiglobus sp.]
MTEPHRTAYHNPVRELPRPDLVPPPRASGLRRLLYVAAGLTCVGLAYLGAVLPGLPVTPWVLLASYCFARSSRRLHRWLSRSPIFGRLIRDWDEHRGIRRPVKVLAVALVVAACGFSIGYATVPPWVKWTIGGLGLVGISVILFVVPTIRDGKR